MQGKTRIHKNVQNGKECRITVGFERERLRRSVASGVMKNEMELAAGSNNR